MKEIITTLITIFLLFGCSNTDTTLDEIKSRLQRELNPDVNSKQLQELVRDNNKFALSLYKKLSSDKDNLLFSPISISHALMMTYLGAAGQTKDEMRKTLFITLDDDIVHKAFNKLDLSVNYSDDSDIFKIANSIWPKKNFNFEKSYLDEIMVNYGSSLKSLDYIYEPEESRKTINSWVEQNTDNKIKDLIPKGSINEMTKMVLTNAVYFKAKWQKPFDAHQTKKGLFEQKEVDFMHQKEVFDYFEDENLQAIKLNYKSGKNSMIILLPKDKKSLELTDIYIEKIQDNFQRYRVTLSMPRFKFTSNSISLSRTLKELGMNSAFDYNRANFSKMSQDRLYISDVVHKAFISVDELGTEAAASTAALLATTGIEIVPDVNMSIDRSFIYMIVDNDTKAILFLGHLKKP